MIHCVIIDDEELARTLLRSYIARIPSLTLLGDFENPLDALPLLKQERIDLVFLDIQMPNVKGTDFAKLIDPKTKVVFTTAYADYAIQGFELNALDYLLKPITFERFLEAYNKLATFQKKAADTTLTIKSGYDLFKLKISDIDYIASDGEYVVYHTATQKIMSHGSLKKLEETLDPSQFLRIHRSYIVNQQKVIGLKGRDLLLQNKRLPVSDSFYEQVKSRLF
ncbi:LytTR family DNA-binding domain-containing protein [Flavobacteriaceae bacterium F08102]|nr:LytTR family DNA-binding domain-containing protein [Flavobacteriaceae bacterium F08102]